MKIYFTASVSSGRYFLPQYKFIVQLLENMGHKVLSRDVAFEDWLPDINRLKTDKNLNSEEIFNRERIEILEADIVVAEVTKPSMGASFLISYALNHRKHVLALIYEDNEDKISPFIEGNPSQNMFLEHYSEDNLKIVFRNFFKYIETNKRKKGKMVVIDGGDGSGKKTQAELLLKYLGNNQYKAKYIDFPRYYSSFHGRTVARYLKGEFGTMAQVNPYLASLAYALDRLSARDEMEEWLMEGNIIVANRYVSSSMGFQSARVLEKDKEKFINWLYEMEYKEHKLPKEDVLIYLYVPVEVSQKLIEHRGSQRYLKGDSKDIHEQNIDFLKKVEKAYLELVKKNKNWVKIDCINRDGVLRSREDIHSEIIRILKEREII